MYSRGSHVAIIVFDFKGSCIKYEVKNPFESVMYWTNLTRQHLGNYARIIVAGKEYFNKKNNADLKSQKN